MTTPVPGAHEAHIARSAVAQQGAQAVGVLAMLAALTLVARSFGLAEFGLYGLLVSLVGYVLIAQLSVEGAAVRAIASATDADARERAFSVAVTAYLVLGTGAGVLVAGGGLVLVELLPLSADLTVDGRLGVALLGAAVTLGWPAKSFHDWLRGTQRFVLAAAAEAAAYVVFVAGVTAMIVLDAPLWALIGLGGSLPVMIGVAAAIAARAARAPIRFRRAAVTRASLRELLGFSAYLSAIGVADIVIYQLDRVILAGFLSTAAVGLYEGAARPHQLVRQIHGTLVLTVMPVASAYLADRDEYRLRELLLRGTRYVLAVVVPVTVVLMVLSEPILDVWLGERFDGAALGLTLFVSYWVVGANTGVAGAMLVAAGKVRELTVYAWAGALVNLVLSLALTPLIGLEGVILGTVIPSFLLLPWFLRIVTRTFPVRIGDLAREAWLPAYSVGAALAVALGGLRLVADLDSLPALAAAGGGALAAGWIAYYALWLRPAERVLIRSGLRRAPAA